ncbi:UNVERIFIED_CONTAM: nucleotide-binding universal stress UspA family protein [Williamsia faeni]
MSTETMRLTVGYLYTDTGDDGVNLAIAIATSTGAAIDLVCVVRAIEPDGTPGRTGFQEALVNKAQKWLEEGAEDIPDDIEVALHTPVAESFPQALIDFAVQSEATMIVVGGTSDGILGKHTLGSISSALTHASPIPVALAPRGYTVSGRPVIPTLTVAIPTTESKDSPLPFALDVAKKAGLNLRLLSLVSHDDVPGEDEESMAVRQRHIAAATENLELAMKSCGDTVEIESLVAEGNTVEEALEQLTWSGGDALVIGSGHLAPPRRAFLGSMSARILKNTNAPIVVVPRDYTP